MGRVREQPPRQGLRADPPLRYRLRAIFRRRAAAVASLGAVALLASAIPARRAAQVDPMSTLKDD